MQKKVSAIIPFFNRVDWLCEAVQSVIDQTYNNIEIIVVNDGSEEDVSGFLEKYGVKIIYKYKKNGGAATARNLGMKIASGEYLAFLDSDDIWLPNKTKMQIEFMEERGAMWSHTGFFYWTPSSNNLRVIDNRDNYGDVTRKFFISTKIATPSVIIKSELLNKHPELIFPEEYRIGQDVRFFYSISQYYRLALLRKPLVKIRMRKDNSYSNVLERFSSRAAIYKEIKSDRSKPHEEKIIFFIYYFYHNLFGKEPSKIKNVIGKIFLVLPYCLERLYSMKINKAIRADKANDPFIK